LEGQDYTRGWFALVSLKHYNPKVMKIILLSLEVATSCLLGLCILLQHRASGLTSTFGGGGATFVQRRGAEKLIYKASIWLAVIFFALALGLLAVA
jgi:protein translocase SecG subunit